MKEVNVEPCMATKADRLRERSKYSIRNVQATTLVVKKVLAGA
jgi:hypothetical protein